MKNSQHLKAYVQMHPENKMAWYLLGKEYYKNGQHGKGNYCFNQAGEVYEAFEHSKVPADMLREYEEGLLQAGRQRSQRHQRTRRLLLLFAMFLLVIMPAAQAPSSSLAGEHETGLVSHADAADAPVETISTDTSATESKKVSFTAQAVGDTAASGKAMATMIGSKKPSVKAVLGMKRAGKWLLWKEKLPLTSTLETSKAGAIVYQSYDPVSCACQPPEHTVLTKQAAQWQVVQEQLATLWSAILAFQKNKGSLPDSLQQLAGPFPGNWLGGTTPVMKQKFTALRAAAESSSAPGVTKAFPTPNVASGTSGAAATSGTSAVTGVSGGGEDSIPFFAGPLTIIVDKQNHRLAVVSGSIILRNYKVGLGGNKTPEGSFVITDKVVNPNGHANGEFGSRGLQLSESNYAIHGTNDPNSIGEDESQGCIRMKREDVEELFALVPKGTKVTISKGVLPEELVLPKERFSSSTPHDQTNPRKVYHWLN
ncbi:L,D-transpeptidase [Paenibacillus monticola]|uniref:L,D-transpeptidase family protein n=1 Tax=Paenibacillus monticola TaxID=2666075 RepID=A0A7X2L0J6_9BACL|nr:L,D-transpeptidase [Paenibacillus monticola]MRN52777.1 L,D-transpeptidase family protein [Paenibacillus monticola]